MGITFITGNPKKAEFLEKYLGHPVIHAKLDLDEIQSLDLEKIAEHKVRQAYQKIHKAVLVEDISFGLDALGGKLPGPFIKWFLKEIGLEGICRMLDSYIERGATTEVCYAFFDGQTLKFFNGKLHGQVPKKPQGDDSFGWNSIFIPDGQVKTNAQMSEEEMQRFSLRTATVYPELKKFLAELDNN